MNRFYGITAVLLAAAATLSWASGQPEELSPGVYAEVETERGTMTFLLDFEGVPLTVTNFAGLAEGLLPNDAAAPGVPYFNDQTFYRDAPGYAVFAGDPTASGSGGPGYTIPREGGGNFSAAEPGVLMMDGFIYEASGSRFMITRQGDSFLDSRYTAFGRLVSGESVLKKIKQGDLIKSVTILRVGPEAEALNFTEEAFAAELAEARELEFSRLAEIDPKLGEALLGLGDKLQKTPTGIYYTVTREGDGETPVSGSKVSMHYTGYLLDGTVFDSSIPRGRTFDFVLGRDGVIPGWVEMVMGMKVREQRSVVIPPRLAYGDNEYGPIPAGSWLLFDMELSDITEAPQE